MAPSRSGTGPTLFRTRQGALHRLRQAAGWWLAAIAAISLLAVGAALYTQHVWQMQPCPWCILQRVVFLAVAAVALLGLATRGWGLRLTALVIAGLAAAGATAAAWQHWVAAASASCKLTWADRFISQFELDALWPQGFAVFATCAEAKTRLLGVPYEFFSGALFVAVAAAALLLASAPRGSSRRF